MRTALVLASLFAAHTAHAEWSGRIGFEASHFWNAPQNPAEQQHTYGSVFIEPKYNAEWDGGKQQFNFTGFARFDPQDSQRQHADIRELEYLRVGEFTELRVGIRKVFWGATEAQRLTDIINQSDIVDDVSGDTKLGQPMLNLAFINGFGSLDLYLLPGFRERTFPGEAGRPRFRFVIDNDRAVYEAGNDERHVDFAARFASGDHGLDFGLTYFYGTHRQPRYVPVPLGGGRAVIAPYYDLIHQVGLDATYAAGAWLWKFEGITRRQLDDWFQSVDVGFEYTYSGVFDSAADLGVLAEYLWDSRGVDASQLNLTNPFAQRLPPYAFQNDLFLGMRYALNDTQSTQVLAGITVDLEGRGYTYTVKAERRLGDDMKLNLEWRGFNNTPTGDVLDAFAQEDYLRLTLSWYF
jgi:hypothetical protein